MSMRLLALSERPTSLELKWTPVRFSLGLAYVFRSDLGICQISLHSPNGPCPDPLALAQKICVEPRLQEDLSWKIRGQQILENDLNAPAHTQEDICLYGTPFQLKVWKALYQVPYATTVTYQELAIKAGFSGAHARPVGSAVGANPVAILVPCHRVLPASGEIGNFGWGIDFKRKLLERESEMRHERRAHG